MNININIKQPVLVFDDYKIYKNLIPFKNLEFAKNIEDNFVYDNIENSILDVSVDSTKVEKWLKNKYDKTIEVNDKVLSRAVSKNNNYKTYFFNEAIGLYTELSKVNPFMENDIISFCKSFGIPVGSISFEGVDYFLTVGEEGDPVCIQYVQLKHIQKSLILYLYIFDIFKNIALSDVNSIVERDKQMGKLYKEMNYNDVEILNEEKEYFTHIVGRVDYSRLKLNYHKTNDNNEFQLDINHISLIEYAVFQMVHALINGSNFKACKNCGHIFEVTHEKMLFCPPLPFRKRSSCEMAYRNKSRKK